MAKPIRIFISSTFQDMHEERDLLVQEVFPHIRENCRRERNLRLVDVDLRWGIPEGKITDDTLVDICLEEIDRCEPFFICLIGNRYGTLAKVDEEKKQKLGLGQDEYSITELEIRRRLQLYNEEKAGLLFYFRDTSSLAGNLDSLNGTKKDKERLKDLKDYIYSHVPEENVWEYSHLYESNDDNSTTTFNKNDFVNKVIEDLWTQICEKYPVKESEESEEFRQEFRFQKEQVDYKSDHFIGREDILQGLQNHIRSYGKEGPVFVTGESGTGKSTLMAKVIKEFEEQDQSNLYLPVFVGLSKRTSTVKDIVRYIIEVLTSTYDDVGKMEDYADFNTLLWKLKGRKVTIFLDGIDQILDPDSRDLHKILPAILPSSVRLIVSAASGSDQIKIIKKSFPGNQIFEVKGLKKTDIQKIAEDMLKLHGKEMTEEQMEELIKNDGAFNPLFLKMLLGEMRYFVPKKQGNYNKQVLDYICTLPSDLNSFIQQILERLEGDNNKEIVAKTLQLISCSRKSLSEDEIGEILKETMGKFVPEFQWIISSLKEHLLTVSDSQFQTVHIYHQSIKDGITNRYLKGREDITRIHSYLAEYHFKKFKDHHSDRAESLNEFLYHWMIAEQWEKIENVISNISYLEDQFKKSDIYAFIEDLYHLYDYQGIPAPLKEKVGQLLLFINREKDLLSHHPQLVQQQAINQVDVRYLCESAKKYLSGKKNEKLIFELVNKQHVNDQIRRKLSDDSEICNVVTSPDGEKISALFKCNSWRMWKVKTGKQEIDRKIKVESDNGITTHAILFEAGKAIFGTSQGEIYSLNIESGILAKKQVFTSNSRALKFIAVSPNEQFLSFYYEDGVIKVWDFIQEKELQHYQSPYEAYSLKFDTAGHHAWLLCEQGKIVRLGLMNEEFKLIEPFGGEKEKIRFYDYDPVSGRRMNAQNHTAYFLTIDGGIDKIIYPDREEKHISACAIDSIVERAAFVVHNNIHIYNQNKVREDLFNVASNISEISFIPNSNQLLCIQDNRVIQLVDFKHFNDNKDAVYQKETIIKCEFFDEGKKFLTVCKDGTAKIWDLELQITLKLYKEFLGKRILDAIVTKDNNTLILLAQKGHFNYVCLFDLTNLYRYGYEKKIIKDQMGEVEVLFRIQEKSPHYIALSPDGQYMVVQDQLGAVRMINLFKLREEHCIQYENLLFKKEEVISVDFDKTISKVALSFSDGIVIVYDTNSMMELIRIQSNHLIKGINIISNEGFIYFSDTEVTQVTFLGSDIQQKLLFEQEQTIIDISTYVSDDGEIAVASLSNDGVLKVSNEGEMFSHPVWKDTAVYTSEEESNITKCVFLSKDRILTTSSNDQMVRLWKIERKERELRLIGEYFVPGACYSCALDNQGKIALADKQGKVHFIKEFTESNKDLERVNS